jgi:hypothetical protein
MLLVAEVTRMKTIAWIANTFPTREVLAIPSTQTLRPTMVARPTNDAEMGKPTSIVTRVAILVEFITRSLDLSLHSKLDWRIRNRDLLPGFLLSGLDKGASKLANKQCFQGMQTLEAAVLRRVAKHTFMNTNTIPRTVESTLTLCIPEHAILSGIWIRLDPFMKQCTAGVPHWVSFMAKQTPVAPSTWLHVTSSFWETLAKLSTCAGWPSMTVGSAQYAYMSMRAVFRVARAFIEWKTRCFNLLLFTLLNNINRI